MRKGGIISWGKREAKRPGASESHLALRENLSKKKGDKTKKKNRKGIGEREFYRQIVG